MKQFNTAVPFLVVLLHAAGAHAGILLRFDQPQYTADVNQTVAVHVILDADDSVAGDQVLPDGLFSMAFTVTFDSSKAATSPTQVNLPADLNDNGLGQPPITASGSGFYSVRAALKTTANDVYRGENGVMRLATIPITRTAPGDFQLGISLFTTSSNDSVFIDGSGAVLDGGIQFGSATVTTGVIPEPSTGLLLASLLILGHVRRRSGLRASASTLTGQDRCT